MSATTDHAAPSRSPAAGVFLRARLGSLLAVLPLGVWTVAHLWNNLAAFQGERAWESAVTEYAHPVSQLVTAIVVLLPLVLHIVWGIGRLFTSRPNNVRAPFFSNLKYLLQRLSALGLIFFIGAHMWLAMLKPRLVEGHAETFQNIAAMIHHHLPTLAVYILGILGIAFHLANGIHTFAMGWGVVSSRRALKKLGVAVVALFVVLLGLGFGALYALWAAGGQLPPPQL